MTSTSSLAVLKLPPIPVICGPTGSGKTGAAVKLAEKYPVEVVSADSRQIIKRLDIGTAKPTPEERRLAPCHLIDMIEPGEVYSAYQFIDDADTAIADIISRPAIPIVVGGTGLYLRALTEGVVEIKESRPELRERLESEMEQFGPEVMHRRLVEIDPEEAARIHPNNRVRVIRAIEIFELTGTPKSELTASGMYKKSMYAFSLHCFVPPRDELYARIDRRVDIMMNEGLLAEVDRFQDDGLTASLRQANVIGYEELLDYRAGLCSLDEAVAKIKQNSRRYAKRQMTWFRHQSDCHLYTDPHELQTGLTENAGRLAEVLKLDTSLR